MVRIAQTPDPSQDPKHPFYEKHLQLSQSLVTLVMKQLTEHPSLEALGITILDVSYRGHLTLSPKRLKALEAEARESLLKRG